MTVQYVVVADIALKDPLMASYVKQGHIANQDLQMKHLAHLDSSVERERLYPQNAGEEHFAKMEALMGPLAGGEPTVHPAQVTRRFAHLDLTVQETPHSLWNVQEAFIV